MVSLHFYPSFSSIPDLDDAQFHVLVNGHVDLGNFSVGKVRDFAAKEYFIRVDSVKVVINFVPTKKGNFGLFNASEVISAPKRFDCSWDFLLMVSHSWLDLESIQKLIHGVQHGRIRPEPGQP
ncbi:hypothetical protein Peur_017041 [Populus x canadensis]